MRSICIQNNLSFLHQQFVIYTVCAIRSSFMLAALLPLNALLSPIRSSRVWCAGPDTGTSRIGVCCEASLIAAAVAVNSSVTTGAGDTERDIGAGDLPLEDAIGEFSSGSLVLRLIEVRELLLSLALDKDLRICRSV